MQEYYKRMPRAATTLDPFNAVAEPRRRQVLDLLASGERPVNDMVLWLGWSQPQVSKHLGVLRQVGLVNVRREGRQRVYSLNADPLKPIHDWVKSYERFWMHQLSRIKARAEEKVKQSKSAGLKSGNPKSQEN
jgi:DNA-binding transcriptional ArsR family regulator